MQIYTPKQQGFCLYHFWLILFWIHNGTIGLAAVGFGVDLMMRGQINGIINVIGVFLFWIGGTLTFGLAAIVSKIPRLWNSPT